VVGHPGPLLGGRLRRADVHAPVDLARVGTHDLEAAEPLGKAEREVALPGRGRSADEDERGQAPPAQATRRPTSA
jgi:hypothetical protein